MLPDMKIPPIHDYEQIQALAVEKAAEKGKVSAAVLTASHPDLLKACAQAASAGLIEPLMVGDRTLFEETVASNGIEMPVAGFAAVEGSDTAAIVAARLAEQGKINLIVDGTSETESVLPLLRERNPDLLPRGMVASHVAVLRPSKYKKLLLVADGMVVAEPDLKGKLAVIGNIVRVSEAIGNEKPRIAVLAAVEVVYPQMPVTREGAVLSKMAERRQIKGAYVDGPLSFDVAVDMDAAHSKGITSSDVAGQTDAMLAPNIEVAAGIYQAMTLFGKCDCGGVIVGGSVPIAINARMDSIENRFYSIILGVLTA